MNSDRLKMFIDHLSDILSSGQGEGFDDWHRESI